MVQDRTALAPFFNEHINNNSRYSPKWGPAYHQMVKRVATERPEFRDQSLIKALWYERSNGVASIKQGGMSQNEYNAAQIHLREITTLMHHQEDNSLKGSFQAVKLPINFSMQ